MAAKEPWQLTATEACGLLRKGDLSVEEYVKSLLARIKQRDSVVKAWVYLNKDLVLQRARELDKVPTEERGPLHGLPIGIKDVILTKDMPTQYNSRIYESDKPSGIDAGPVITLRAAGALIFGKLSTTEFAAAQQGNVHQNLTSNAQDPKRTPGGSSSGSGAAVADFQIPIALGTQTGGSIVRPASFNGCYGFKPTWGAISREGLAQWSPTLDTCGFFARSMEDIELMADAYRISDDDAVPKQPFELKGAKIAICTSPVWPKASDGTRNALTKAEEILQAHGAKLERLDLPSDFDNILEWHARVIGGEGRTSFLGNYLMNKDKLHDSIHAHVENRKGISRRAQLEAYDGCARLRPVWDEIAAKYDVVITPSVVDEAPSGLEHTGDMSFCSMWTILQVPALNVPGFAGRNGLPIGLTMVAPRYTDRHLLRVAKTVGPLFEQEGGWKRSSS